MPRSKEPGNTAYRMRRYPWDEWFARKRPFTLKRHADYNGTDASFMQLVRHRAIQVGATVSATNPVDNVVVVTVTSPPGTRAPQKRVRS